jgi:aryl-alcohol dehydrogenase-like predicted oxidoreductase
MAMTTQPIGRSNLNTTRLAYGCMRVAGVMDRTRFTPELEARGRAAILAAYEAGYTHFDHADIYGNGLCEEVFGRVLREVSGMRDRVVIATKCGIRWAGDPTPDAPHRWDFSRSHIVWSCEQSLRRLGIECIDLYMLHRPDYLKQPEDIAAAFEQLHAQGKVRTFGVSN